MKNLGTQTITTRRLILRRFTMNDVDAIFEGWASDPAVTRYLSWLPHADKQVTRTTLDRWVRQYPDDAYYHWGIELQGRLVGAISVVDMSLQNQNAEIGYCLSRAYWGQGIMSEALHCVMSFLFEEVGLHRICMKHDTENIGSGRVMIKNGLTHEGTLRKHSLRKDGTFGDLHVYGMLRAEWNALREKEGKHGDAPR